MSKVGLILVGLVGVAAWLFYCNSCSSQEAVQLDPNQLWGASREEDKSIRPFKIQFSDEMIQDIRSRLNNHRPLTPPLEGVDMEYGMNTNQLKDIIQYWSKEYDFKKREQFLNQFPQFKTKIQGLDIHFIRVVPKAEPGVTVVPLLLLHGWPGSVREFYEAIPMLTKKRAGHDFVFEVIVPSLPGYGFSDPAVRPGLNAANIGVVMRNLMHRLGHQRFFVQGGDWGAVIGSAMSTLYPKEIIGFHTNMGFVMNNCATLKTLLGAFIPSLVVEPHLADRMYPLSWYFSYMLEEFGYLHIQATKPDTVGVGISDSPAGLAAYILEKFASWTVRGSKSIPAHLSRDALLDNLMFYWVPNSITTSMRLYAETMNKKTSAMKLDDVKTAVPTWVMQAKHEISYQPASILKTKYTNLLNTTVIEQGGHFIALELPKILTDDVFKAIKEFRRWQKENAIKKTEL